MTERITPRQFHEAVGVEDWRVLANNACAYFRTGSFPKGVELVAAIDKLADAANHHPEADVATWMGRD
jgi:4a-hydroxytetrahydrobiopterin dehydratase